MVGYWGVPDAAKDLILAAIREAAYLMENVDPDDRSPEQAVLVEEVKGWMRLANDGDQSYARWLVEAVPAWGRGGKQ